MGSHPDDRARALARVPLRRMARAAEVAEAAMFLTSPGGRFITGHVLPVDGGSSATFLEENANSNLAEDEQTIQVS
ncbi:2-(S)-hydroxypropyl-CoM dehydrogenase [Roseovarius gaetbuli]|uniref:2-(S)-hydroxypropyl-CoM dehydrogenase n=2 Tax=Roseovarius gaetbuli TaxID=1356575 RepID=A0A1X7AD68_9RHOB|nr:2-(S)-hydroxypropyl-CoM dehydrogenase [Roseovarius gaetbuli]